MNETATHEWVELADRAGDGLDVRLSWSRTSGAVKVSVTRVPTGQSADLHVKPEHALDAFYHPFAYAASRGTVVRRSEAAAVTAVAGE